MPISFPLMFPPGLAEPCECPPTFLGGPLIFNSSATYNVASTPLGSLVVNNFSNLNKLLLTATADSVIGGIPAQADGFTILVWNVDTTNTITLAHSAGTIPNRFYLPGAVNLVLGPYDGVLLSYTQSLNNGQGGWLAITG